MTHERMHRRAFITLLGTAATSAAWPCTGGAQQLASPVVGFLSTSTPEYQRPRVRSFLQGLSEMGFVEGRNVAIEYRRAEGHAERLPELASDLVRRQVAVIVASDGPNTAHPAHAATQTIPIVYQTGSDPVKDGLVTSMSRSGGNVTAVTRISEAVEPKRLELLHALVPAATTIAVLINPVGRNVESQTKELRDAARGLGLQLQFHDARSEREIEPAIAGLDRSTIGALVIASDALFFGRGEQLAGLSMKHALPTAYETREFVEGGGLVSYGASLMDSYRQVGVYAGRLLKGEKVAEMAVGLPVKFELGINRKTASALALAIPQTLLIQADEVIE